MIKIGIATSTTRSNKEANDLFGLDLRVQIEHLQYELETIAQRYRVAKNDGDFKQAIELVQQKRALARQLFEARSALLLAFATGPLRPAGPQ